MDKGSEVFLNGMLSLTTNEEWSMFIEDLEKEIYNLQANVLENSQNWDHVVFTKGWTKCLAYITSLRDRTLVELENINADV